MPRVASQGVSTAPVTGKAGVAGIWTMTKASTSVPSGGTVVEVVVVLDVVVVVVVVGALVVVLVGAVVVVVLEGVVVVVVPGVLVVVGPLVVVVDGLVVVVDVGVVVEVGVVVVVVEVAVVVVVDGGAVVVVVEVGTVDVVVDVEAVVVVVVGGVGGGSTVMTLESVEPLPGSTRSIFHWVARAFSTRAQNAPVASVVRTKGPNTSLVALSVAYTSTAVLGG
jgi:hypothetical protein